MTLEDLEPLPKAVSIRDEAEAKVADFFPPLRVWGGIAAAWFLWGMISTLRLLSVPEYGWSKAFWYGFPDALIWAALTPFLVFMARRRPIHRERLLTGLAFHAASAILFAILHAGLDTSFSAVRTWVSGGQETYWTLVFFKILFYGFHTNLLVYTLVIGLVQYIDRVRSLAEGERRATELEAQLSAARLARLERQLRPHFLFNALNTVSGLMGQDPQTGRKVVRRLGDLLRASLKNPGQSIPLSEELDLVRAYLDIEQVRFEDMLSVDFDVAPNLQAQTVPALILQPLVENAITHGIAHRPEGGNLRISAKIQSDELWLSVEDDGPGMSQPPTEPRGFGIGLENTVERLEAFYGDRQREYLTLEPSQKGSSGADSSGLRVILRLPISEVES